MEKTAVINNNSMQQSPMSFEAKYPRNMLAKTTNYIHRNLPGGIQTGTMLVETVQQQQQDMIFHPGDPNVVYSKVPDMTGSILSPRGQMHENVVMILNHKSIKNKKHFLDRYAFNKKDLSGVRQVMNQMSQLQSEPKNLTQTLRSKSVSKPHQPISIRVRNGVTPTSLMQKRAETPQEAIMMRRQKNLSIGITQNKHGGHLRSPLNNPENDILSSLMVSSSKISYFGATNGSIPSTSGSRPQSRMRQMLLNSKQAHQHLVQNDEKGCSVADLGFNAPPSTELPQKKTTIVHHLNFDLQLEPYYPQDSIHRPSFIHGGWKEQKPVSLNQLIVANSEYALMNQGKYHRQYHVEKHQNEILHIKNATLNVHNKQSTNNQQFKGTTAAAMIQSSLDTIIQIPGRKNSSTDQGVDRSNNVSQYEVNEINLGIDHPSAIQTLSQHHPFTIDKNSSNGSLLMDNLNQIMMINGLGTAQNSPKESADFHKRKISAGAASVSSHHRHNNSSVRRKINSYQHSNAEETRERSILKGSQKRGSWLNSQLSSNHKQDSETQTPAIAHIDHQVSDDEDIHSERGTSHLQGLLKDSFQGAAGTSTKPPNSPSQSRKASLLNESSGVIYMQNLAKKQTPQSFQVSAGAAGSKRSTALMNTQNMRLNEDIHTFTQMKNPQKANGEFQQKMAIRRVQKVNVKEIMRNSPLRGNQWQKEAVDISVSEYQDLVQGRRIDPPQSPTLSRPNNNYPSTSIEESNKISVEMPLMLGNFGHHDTKDQLSEDNSNSPTHTTSQLNIANSKKEMIRVVSLNKQSQMAIDIAVKKVNEGRQLSPKKMIMIGSKELSQMEFSHHVLPNKVTASPCNAYKRHQFIKQKLMNIQRGDVPSRTGNHSPQNRSSTPNALQATKSTLIATQKPTNPVTQSVLRISQQGIVVQRRSQTPAVVPKNGRKKYISINTNGILDLDDEFSKQSPSLYK